MKLYYSAVLSPHKACAVARYLKSPVEFVYLDLVKGEQQAPAYLVLNPNGKVPTLVDGERVVWEDDAVMCYLAERAGSELGERGVLPAQWPRAQSAARGLSPRMEMPCVTSRAPRPSFPAPTKPIPALRGKAPIMCRFARVALIIASEIHGVTAAVFLASVSPVCRAAPASVRDLGCCRAARGLPAGSAPRRCLEPGCRIPPFRANAPLFSTRKSARRHYRLSRWRTNSRKPWHWPRPPHGRGHHDTACAASSARTR